MIATWTHAAGLASARRETSSESWESIALSALAALLCLLLLLLARWLLPPEQTRKVRTPALLLIVYVISTALAIWLGGASAHPGLRLAAFSALLLALGRIGFVLAVDAILSGRLRRPIPKIFRDILEGVVYTAIVLVVLQQAGADIDALLTTSALLTAVIGLSMQDTLGNLFAGLSLQAQNPFEIGDWIEYGGDDTIGRVVEINWRATKVVTLESIEVVIPNGPLARAAIRNYSKPTRVVWRSIRIVVPFSDPPHRVHRALLAGLEHTEGVLTNPAPSVVTEAFEERGVRYWIRFCIEDFERRQLIDGRVRERIWYALRRANIRLAVPVANLELKQDDEPARERLRREQFELRLEALRHVDFLSVLTDGQIETLARDSHERPYAAGEVIIRAGEPGDELFIVQRGEVAVVLRDGERELEVSRLGSGSFFGEMSVMTGQPRNATVRALTPVLLLVVDKHAMKEVLAASPELAERISEILSARREQLESASTKATTQVRTVAERRELLDRIKGFFSL